jgi:serine/threonine-protein kinase
MSTPPFTPASSSASAPDPATCPSCGRPIPANAALGACPHCLLAAGLASEPAAPTNTPPPPTPAELALEFPQLEILELLGRGGMGAVYKARQKSLDRLVALKLLRPGLDADPSFAERFTHEARALAKLNHPGIVTLYEFGRTPGGLFFILMEFVDGLNLRQLLAAGRLSPREALAIVPPLCDALQYAHDRGLIHRDIKPENILIDRLGRVKIADFGLAKLAASSGPASRSDTQSVSASAHSSTASDAGHWSLSIGHSGLTEVGRVFGTPGYMAPEQRDRPSSVDHRADIYALGVVLYQMLTGELPDATQLQPPSHRVQLDIRLDEIVLRALEKNPSLRYAAASELKTQLETVASSSPSSPLHPLSPSSNPVNLENPVQKNSSPPPFRAPAVSSSHRIAISAFSLLSLLYLTWVFYSAHSLPERVATHFGISGRADGFMSLANYRLFIAVLPLLLGGFILGVSKLCLRLPARFINIPNRDIWLSPARRPELAAILTRWFAILACLIVVLLAEVHTLTVLANQLQPPRLPDIAAFVLIGFPAGLLLWIVGLIMRLAEPQEAARLHKRREIILLAILTCQLGFFAAPLTVAWHAHDEPATSPSKLLEEPTVPVERSGVHVSNLQPEPEKFASIEPNAPPSLPNDTGQEIFRLKREEAKRRIATAQFRVETGQTTQAELLSAQDDLMILEAGFAGDRVSIAKIKAAAAKRRFADINERHNAGLTTNDELSSAKTELAIRQLELNALLKTQDAQSRDPASADTPDKTTSSALPHQMPAP